jgi:hypothetical protein
MCDFFHRDRERARTKNQETWPQAQRRGHLRRGPGKGSHGRLYYGGRFTTLKDRTKEIGPGLLKAMLDQLGLTKDDLEI